MFINLASPYCRSVVLICIISVFPKLNADVREIYFRVLDSFYSVLTFYQSCDARKRAAHCVGAGETEITTYSCLAVR